MLDQALKINPKNEKSLLRKCQCAIELVEYDKANLVLKELEDVAFQSLNSQQIYADINRMKAQLNKPKDSEKEFSQNIFKP